MKLVSTFFINNLCSSTQSLDRSTLIVISENDREIIVYDIEKNKSILVKKTWMEVAHPSLSEGLTKAVIISYELKRYIFKYIYRYFLNFFLKKDIIIDTPRKGSTVKVINIENGKLCEKFFEGITLCPAIFCKGNSQLLICGHSFHPHHNSQEEKYHNKIFVWDSNLTAQQDSIVIPSEYPEDFKLVAASDGDTIASVGVYNFYIWKVSTKKIIFNLFKSKNSDGTLMEEFIPSGTEIDGFGFSGDGKSFAVLYFYPVEDWVNNEWLDNNICLYSINNDEIVIKSWHALKHATRIILSATGAYLGAIVPTDTKTEFVLYDTETKKEIVRHEDNELVRAYFSKDDEIILCSKSSITAWEWKTEH